jgi:hypothetical protein
MSKPALVWEDPPRPATGVGGNLHNRTPPNPFYAAIAVELQRHPRRWARIGQFDARWRASAELARIKRGVEPAFWPLEDYEFTSRTGKLYARWIGD